MATIAVGDLHGNRAALDDLLSQVESVLEPEDTLVFLGDYVDDGPDVSGCIARILDCRARAPCDVVALMGNHEQWMLQSYDDTTRHSWLMGMGGLRTIASYSPHLAELLELELHEAGSDVFGGKVRLSYHRFFEALPPDHLEFFLTLRAGHDSPDVRCVHGGCEDTETPLLEQPAEQLIWGPHGFPAGYQGKRPVVYGHHNDACLTKDGWPEPHILQERTFGIDTIRHGVLTAMRFPDRRVFQSKRFWVEDAAR